MSVGYDLHSRDAWLCVPDSGGGRVQSADSGAPSGDHAGGGARGRGLCKRRMPGLVEPIVNTDQGKQHTAREFVDAVMGHGVQLSMD